MGYVVKFPPAPPMVQATMVARNRLGDLPVIHATLYDAEGKPTVACHMRIETALQLAGSLLATAGLGSGDEEAGVMVVGILVVVLVMIAAAITLGSFALILELHRIKRMPTPSRYLGDPNRGEWPTILGTLIAAAIVFGIGGLGCRP
jgi:hypothetical protein